MISKRLVIMSICMGLVSAPCIDAMQNQPLLNELQILRTQLQKERGRQNKAEIERQIKEIEAKLKSPGQHQQQQYQQPSQPWQQQHQQQPVQQQQQYPQQQHQQQPVQQQQQYPQQQQPYNGVFVQSTEVKNAFQDVMQKVHDLGSSIKNTANQYDIAYFLDAVSQAFKVGASKVQN